MAHRGCTVTGGKKGKHRRRLKPWQPPRVIRTEWKEPVEEMERIRKNARVPREYVTFQPFADAGAKHLADVMEALGEKRKRRKEEDTDD